MKRKLNVLLLITLACVLAFSACINTVDPGPTEIEIPTPEPTAEPRAIDAEAIDACLGDWYGVFSVTGAGGAYAPNSGVKNDCAMRAALDAFGRGTLYLVVNGLGADSISGSKNVFALCAAELTGDGISVRGMVNRYAVDWLFTQENGLLRLNGRVGDENDNMDIEILLSRPDALAASGLEPDALAYVNEHGFGGVISLLGGSERELPSLNPAEGMDAHDFFSAEPEGASIEDPIPVGTLVTGANGHITLNLPAGYIVIENDAMGFIVAGPEDGLIKGDFSYTSWDTDALSFLVSSVPALTELYHYTVDGFDFYGTFAQAPANDESLFRLCGVKDGKLVIVNLLFSVGEEQAKTFLSGESFRMLIMGMKAE